MKKWYLVFAVCFLSSQSVYAASSDIFHELTLPFVLVLVFAKLFGFLAIKIHLPSLVGEIFGGILLGNLALFGLPIDLNQTILHSAFFQYAAELGVILLLFLVGLESNVGDILKSGRNSSMTAIMGVMFPVFLGSVAAYFLGFNSLPQALLVGATFSATSVGITARLLADSGKLKTPSAQVVLGAAVIDDVLGLILLAMLGGLVASGVVEIGGLFSILLKVVLFFALALLFGHYGLTKLFRQYVRIDHPGFLPVFALIFALVFAQLSVLAGLAPIIGAFTAGLLLDDLKLKKAGHLSVHHFDEVVRPMVDLLLPLFLVSIGLQVQLNTLAEFGPLVAVLILTLIALLSKALCGFACRGDKLDKWGIGFGMIPRGEVGLIFASFGLSQGLVDAKAYGILVMVVLLTTIIGPLLLKLRLKRF